MSKLTPKQEAALNILEEGREFEEYFFSRAKKPVWFNALKERGYFSPDKNPPVQVARDDTFYYPHWSVLDYLEKVSEVCGETGDLVLAAELMQIVREVTEAEAILQSRNAGTWWCFIKIMSKLPGQAIASQDIELIKVWLESGMGESNQLGREIGISLLPKLLGIDAGSDSSKAYRVIEIVTEIKWRESKFSKEQKPHSAIEGHWLSQLFKQNSEAIALNCGPEVMGLLQERFIKATEQNNDDKYSYMWRPAIEENEQNRRREEVQDILVSALRDILITSVSIDKDISGTLEDMLQASYVTPRRVALFVIGTNFNKFAHLFWDSLSVDLFAHEYQHELYELLRRNFREFSKEEQKSIVEIVKNLEGRMGSDEDDPRYHASIRIDWLHAIKGQGDSDADKLYAEYVDLLGGEPENPDFASFMDVGWGSEEPIEISKLLGMSIQEIVKYLSEFEQEKEWNAPTEEGLGKVFKEAVSKEPEKFTEDIDQLKDTKLIYKYYLLSGFKDAWKEQKVLDWGTVIVFCQSIVEDEAFWKQDVTEKDYPSPNRKWISSAISDLIAAGVRNDDWAIPERYLSDAERILLRILHMDESSADPEDTDALTESINTSRGRGIEAFLDFALHCARLEDKKCGNHNAIWERIRATCENELAKCVNDNYEYSALIAAYIPNMLYLDKEWTLEHLSKIFCKEYPRNWYFAMSGYSYVNTSYKEIYDFLRNNGDYELVITTDLGNEQMYERLLEHVCLAYLYQGETIEDPSSPFLLLLKEWRERDISTITRFMWGRAETDKKEEVVEQITDYWRWCSARVKGEEEENRIVVSDLNLLIGYFSEIDETIEELLIQSAPYVNDHHNMSFFLEYLDQLSNESIKQVAQIFRSMLKRSVPYHDQDLTRDILTKLYDAGLLSEANEIADTLAVHRMDVRDIYDRYNG